MILPYFYKRRKPHKLEAIVHAHITILLTH